MVYDSDSCCSGCSLRTDNLIILWLTGLNVALDAVLVLPYLISTSGVASSWATMLLLFRFVLAIYALNGICRRKPSLLLPFIGLSVLIIVMMATLWGLFLIAPSFVISSGIFEQFVTYDSKRQSDYYSSSYIRQSVKTARVVYTGAVLILETFILVYLVLNSYMTVVVYNYYKQMVGEIKEMMNTGGAGIMGGGDYPHIQPIAPPPYDYQPHGVYFIPVSREISVEDTVSLLSDSH